MTVPQILKQLKARGDRRAVAVWQRLGMDAARYYGVGLTKIRTFARGVGKDHSLALALWDTGIHDARLLATWVEEPRRAEDEQLDRWVETADYWDLSDKVCQNVVAATVFARSKVGDWREHPQEFVRRSAYVLLGELARKDRQMKDADFIPHLDTIQTLIHRESNWVREAMYLALMQIGARNRALNGRSLSALERVGPVQVDYGETSCKLPDARAWLTSDRVTAKFSA